MNRGRIGAGALTAVIATLACAGTASAQDARSGFGNRGDFVIGADRLVPLISYTAETVPGADSNSRTQYSGGGVSLLLGTDPHSTDIPNMYAVPRVGFDYFLTDMLTLGAEVGVAFTTGGASYATTDNANSQTTTVKNSLPNYDAIVAGVRAGVVFKLADMISVWPRAGFSYIWGQARSTNNSSMSPLQGTTIATEGFATNTVSQFGLDVDPQLVISPWKHVGFTIGVTAGIPLASCASTHGHQETTTTIGTTVNTTTLDGQVSTNANNWYVGANAGVLVYF